MPCLLLHWAGDGFLAILIFDFRREVLDGEKADQVRRLGWDWD
jgi:hypothetical protein